MPYFNPLDPWGQWPQVPATTPPFLPGPAPGYDELARRAQTPQPAPQPAVAEPVQPGAPELPSKVPAPGGVGTRVMNSLRDPRLQMLLMAMGAGLSQPRRVGQTGWGHAAEAMTGGYNALAQAAELRRKQDIEERKLRVEEKRGEADVTESGANVEVKKATAAAIPRETAVKERAQTLDESMAMDKLALERGALNQRKQEHADSVKQAEKELALATRNYELNKNKAGAEQLTDQARLKLQEKELALQTKRVNAEVFRISTEAKNEESRTPRDAVAAWVDLSRVLYTPSVADTDEQAAAKRKEASRKATAIVETMFKGVKLPPEVTGVEAAPPAGGTAKPAPQPTGQRYLKSKVEAYVQEMNASGVPTTYEEAVRQIEARGGQVVTDAPTGPMSHLKSR